MKLLLALLFPVLCYAASPYNYYVVLSSSNMAQTFPTVAQMSGPTTRFSEVNVANASAFTLEVNCTSNTKPSSGAANSIYVLPYSTATISASDQVQTPLGKYCWMRSVGSTANAGNLSVFGLGY